MGGDWRNSTACRGVKWVLSRQNHMMGRLFSPPEWKWLGCVEPEVERKALDTPAGLLGTNPVASYYVVPDREDRGWANGGIGELKATTGPFA